MSAMDLDNKGTPVIVMSRRILSSESLDYDNQIHIRHDVVIKSNNKRLTTLIKDGKGDDIDYKEIAKRYQKEDISSTSLLNFFTPSKQAKRRSDLVENLSSSFITPYKRLQVFSASLGKCK